MDSALLRAFVVAAEQEHFGRAAERLSLSQQGLSKRIRRLESVLAVELFRRTTRRVELTDVGRRFLPAARQAVDAVDAAVDVARSEHRPLRVAALDEHLTPLRLLRDALTNDQELDVEVITNIDIDDVLTRLWAGDVDVSFGWIRSSAGPWPPDVQRRLIAVDRIELLLPAGHPLAVRGTAVTAGELAAVPLWFPSVSAPRGWMDFLQEWAAAHAITLDPSGSSLGFGGFLDRVADGRVSVYGSGMPDPADPRLVRLPVIDPIPLVTWWILWRRTVSDDRVARLVAAIGTLEETTIAMDGLDAATVWVPISDRLAVDAELDRKLSQMPISPVRLPPLTTQR